MADLPDMLDDEPTPGERAQALVAALRARSGAMAPDPERMASIDNMRQLGTLGQLTGDRVISPAGTGLLHQAQQEASLEAMAPTRRLLAESAAQRASNTSRITQDREEGTGAFGKGLIKYGTNALGQVEAQNTSRPEVTMVDDNKRPAKLLRGGKGGAGKAGAPASALTPEALDLMVENGYRSGVEPGFGRDYASRDAYRNRMAALHPGADLVGNHAATRANTADLTEAQKLASSTDVNEGKALADIEILQKTMKPLLDTGSPFFNKVGRELQQKSGNSEVSAYLAAHQAALATINKVLNAGTLTESARKEAQELLSKDLTPAQMNASLEVLKQDMSRSRESTHKRVDEAKLRISGKQPAPEKAAPPSAPTTDRKARIQARLRELDPDGKMDPETLKAQLRKEFPPEVAQR
jgi:hypothetical protein